MAYCPDNADLNFVLRKHRLILNIYPKSLNRIPTTIVTQSLWGLLLSLFLSTTLVGQVNRNNIEVRVKNDDAGEISNWLNTGDDLGETQSLFIAANLLKKDSTYNFRFKIESTEYSALNILSPEPRDILFREVNHFRLGIDNNKFKHNTFFYSGTIGLFYIQGRKITPGATGQKYYWHEWLVNKFYQNKYWEYIASPVKDRFIPYLEFSYGHNQVLFKRERMKLNMSNSLECRLASQYNFTGLGARSYFDLYLSNSKYKLQAIDITLEGYYLTNITQYQTSFVELGIRLNFKHFASYFQINKPISKYLNNPFILYDDMEILFNYGLMFLF